MVVLFMIGTTVVLHMIGTTIVLVAVTKMFLQRLIRGLKGQQ